VLLSLAARALQQLGFTTKYGCMAAVAITSVAFAVAHYVGPAGDTVNLASADFWLGFSFRTMAGALFGMLFVCRGFGIAAGTHAGYDILVGVLG
jgi:membrane protease YdiL (CAAX protease family)